VAPRRLFARILRLAERVGHDTFNPAIAVILASALPQHSASPRDQRLRRRCWHLFVPPSAGVRGRCRHRL